MNKRLKAVGWITLCGAAFLLAGDRLALPQADPNVLRFAHTFTTASERAIMDAAIAEFERAHPPIRIVQTIWNSETYQTLGWRLQFRGRKQPDIYFHWRGFKVDQLIERGWAADLTPYLDPAFLAEFLPAGVEQRNGGIYHLPQSADISNLVWYNTSFFAAEALKEPKTLDEWLETCVTLRRAGILPLAQGNRDLWPMGNFGAELLGQSLGTAKLNALFEPGTTVRAEDLAGLAVLERLRLMRCFDHPGVLEVGAIAGLSDLDAKVLFLNGKSGQHVVGSWFMADIQDARDRGELRFPVGVFPVPSGAGEVDAMTSVTTGYLMNPRCSNKKAAAAFLQLLLSRKYQAEFAKLGNLSLRRDALEFTTDPAARKLLSILGATRVMVPPPDTGYAPEQAQIFYEICARVVRGGLSLEAAADWWNQRKARLRWKSS